MIITRSTRVPTEIERYLKWLPEFTLARHNEFRYTSQCVITQKSIK